MEDVEGFFLELPENQRKIALALHKFICSFPAIDPKIRYQIPFYFRKSWICYLNPIKKENAIELAFTRGNELSNEQGLLRSNGRKQILGVTFKTASEIPFEILREILLEALFLDDTVSYSVKKKKPSN